MIRRALLAVVVLLGASFGTIRAQESTALKVVAAAVFGPLTNDLANVYGGSGAAPVVHENGYQESLKELDAGTSDIAILDRAPAAGGSYIDHQLAIVPYALVTNPQAGIESLTSSQIAAIFSGSVTNWSQAGGANVPVTIVERPATSGTTALFTSVFGAATAHGTLVDNTSRAVLDAVRQTRGGIGVIGLAYGAPDGVKVVAIDGALPSAETIAARRYRFYTYVHAITVGPPTVAASRFISFAETRRELLHKAGFLTVFETKGR